MGKKLLVYSIPVIVVAAVAWFSLRSGGSRAVQIGDHVPDFDLPLFNAPGASGEAGKGMVDLGNFRGKVVVLNFWATWCPPCVAETPSLEEFARKVQPLGVVVIGVSVDENVSALTAFIDKYHLTYPIARQPSRALAARYGTLQFPETYIIDRTGCLAEKIISNTDWVDPRMLAFVRDLAQPGVQQASN
jgi:cytochrome c biogenesis protein CcmG, thiol:disulfide interchange protein DsbE